MSRQKTTKNDVEGRSSKDMADEISTFKDMKLPEITNKAVKSELISGMARKSAKRVIEEIEYECDKTVHFDVKDTTPPRADDLYEGLTVEVERYVQEDGDLRRVIEGFTIEKKLSSEQNMAGDVYKATRTWDGKEYGNVVLKTLKKKHLKGPRERLDNMMKDADAEISNLHRFKDCMHIVKPTGEPFALKDSRLVAQMEYLPRSFSSYLLGIETEDALTKAILCGGIQLFRAIHYLKNKGCTYIDMKESNLGMDLVGNEWMIKLLDADSIVPTGPRTKSAIRYTTKYIDPEKLMLLHEPGVGLLADPSETIYSTGLTLLYAIARRVGVSVRRVVDVSELVNRHHEEGEDDSSQRVSRVSIYQPDKLKEKIEKLRALDEMNLIKVFYLNEANRLMEDNIGDIYTGSLQVSNLIDIHMDEILAENTTIHPCVFEAIRECLKPRINRQDIAAIAWRFNDILEKYTLGRYE
jgi:serine/threonine protein kinase